MRLLLIPTMRRMKRPEAQMKTSNPITATLLFIAFAIPAASVYADSIAQAAAMATAGLAHVVAIGAIAYGLAAIAYGLLFCIAVAIAGVSNR